MSTQKREKFRGAVIQVNFNYSRRGVPRDLLAELTDEKVVVTMSSAKWGNGHAEAGLASEITDENFQEEAFGGIIGDVQAVIDSHAICSGECATYLEWYTGSSIGVRPGEYGYVKTGIGGIIELSPYEIEKFRATGQSAYDAIVDEIGAFPIEPSEGWAPPPQN